MTYGNGSNYNRCVRCESLRVQELFWQGGLLIERNATTESIYPGHPHKLQCDSCGYQWEPGK